MNFSRLYGIISTSLGQNGWDKNNGDKMSYFGSAKAKWKMLDFS